MRLHLNKIRKTLTYFPPHNSSRALHIVDGMAARLVYSLRTHDAHAQLLAFQYPALSSERIAPCARDDLVAISGRIVQKRGATYSISYAEQAIHLLPGRALQGCCVLNRRCRRTSTLVKFFFFKEFLRPFLSRVRLSLHQAHQHHARSSVASASQGTPGGAGW